MLRSFSGATVALKTGLAGAQRLRLPPVIRPYRLCALPLANAARCHPVGDGSSKNPFLSRLAKSFPADTGATVHRSSACSPPKSRSPYSLRRTKKTKKRALPGTLPTSRKTGSSRDFPDCACRTTVGSEERLAAPPNLIRRERKDLTLTCQQAQEPCCWLWLPERGQPQSARQQEPPEQELWQTAAKP